jgi:hypothetical protein
MATKKVGFQLACRGFTERLPALGGGALGDAGPHARTDDKETASTEKREGEASPGRHAPARELRAGSGFLRIGEPGDAGWWSWADHKADMPWWSRRAQCLWCSLSSHGVT